MFDYDRELNLSQELYNSTNNLRSGSDGGLKTVSRAGSESSAAEYLECPSPHDEEASENSIVQGLTGLLRRCSSPNNAFKIGQFRQKSASVGSYSSHFLSRRQQPLFQRQHQYANKLQNGISMDQGQMVRRLSGGSTTATELFDCDVSSGYGSPGMVGTPLSSPAAMNSAQFIATQLQKMFADQGIAEEDGELMKEAVARAILTPSAQSQTMMAMGPTGTPTPPTMLKATTTTTGTNKNSNKRKTSLNTNGVVPGPPPAEQIVPTEDGFDVREIQEFTQLLTSPRRIPPSHYICHICYQQGHYISDCPSRFNNPYEELTPYQGRKKCYGEFQCEQCKRKWTSQNSVANEAQSCIKCHVPVFPHKQLPVDKAVALGLVKLQRLPVTNVGSASQGKSADLVQDESIDQTVEFTLEESSPSFAELSDTSSIASTIATPLAF